MRRLAVIGGLLALPLGWVLLTAAGSERTDRGRVAAIFDNAQFVVSGEEVKVGGVPVGQVEAVELDTNKRARIVMEIDPRFAAFRADARCSIEPQSVIGERFVQCAPGTPDAVPLREVDGVPTVPVERTSTPVDLDLVLATFRGSRAERLQLLLNELGAGLAGRGDDLNATIRRANPALQATRGMLDAVNSQRARIAPLIDDAEGLVADLDRGGDQIVRFVRAARRTTDVTAARRDALREGLRGLPPLLRAWRPALAAFGDTTRDARPIVRDLSAAAPQLGRLASSLPALSREGVPALDRLARAARSGTRAVPSLRPVVRRLDRFATTAEPVARGLRVLAENLRDRGVIEGATRFVFNATGVIARFDRVGHIAVAEAILNDCAVYATTPGRAECDGHFGDDDPRAATRARRRTKRKPSRPRPAASPPRRPPAAPAPSSAHADPPAAAAPDLEVPGLPPVKLPPEVGRTRDAVEDLLDFLMAR